MIRAFIIEDEPHAQRELKRLLESAAQEVRIDGIADSVEEGVRLLSGASADLIFMDIQLSDGLSFDILEELEVKTPIIFTTAYDEYAIRAFKVNSVDYLLKPIEPEALDTALRKFVQNRMPDLDFREVLKAFRPEARSHKERWAVKVGDKVKRFTQEDIAYFYADDDAVYLVPKDSSAVIIDGTLSALAEQLDPKQFCQISRKLIVSYPSIAKVEKYGSTQYALELSPAFPERVLVSRSRTKDFMQWLDQ